jgi:hypothetical protein
MVSDGSEMFATVAQDGLVAVVTEARYQSL